MVLLDDGSDERSCTLLRDDLGRGLTDDEAQAEAGTHDSVGLGEVILVEGGNVGDDSVGHEEAAVACEVRALSSRGTVSLT